MMLLECRRCKKQVQPTLIQRDPYMGAYCPVCGCWIRWVNWQQWKNEYWRQQSWRSLMREEEGNERSRAGR